MREIKFRAWVDGEMVSPMVVIAEQQEVMFVELSKVTTGHDIKWMQFTGLRDRNGREIYEGDVAEYSSGHVNLEKASGNYVIRWNKKEACFEGYCSNAWYPDGNRENIFYFEEYFNKDIEVIGNIYENPELL